MKKLHFTPYSEDKTIPKLELDTIVDEMKKLLESKSDSYALTERFMIELPAWLKEGHYEMSVANFITFLFHYFLTDIKVATEREEQAGEMNDAMRDIAKTIGDALSKQFGGNVKFGGMGNLDGFGGIDFGLRECDDDDHNHDDD